MGEKTMKPQNGSYHKNLIQSILDTGKPNKKISNFKKEKEKV